MLPSIARAFHAISDALCASPATLVGRGQLTPTEFCAAGDALVAASPAWRWRTSDSPTLALPLSKQFLCITNLPVDAADAAPAAAAAARDDFVDVGAALRDPLAVPAHAGGAFDASITLDGDYRTPRLWLAGVDAAGRALSAAALLGVVARDMAGGTATVEAQHPHARDVGPVLALHPCRHAAMMRALLERCETDAERIEVYLTLFVRGVSGALTVEVDTA